ncbi:MAG: hypothetical protein BRC58_08495 [Cyanobacteria bacterium QS_8_64_29]|nr:MAG: hypothetical protein BRC58_08495 [Cyanobacteria bacterium QS_8_64_29]
MVDWQAIFDEIPVGTSEADLDKLFTSALLYEGLGFKKTEVSKSKGFRNRNNSKKKNIIPDYACYRKSDSFSHPILVVEHKSVNKNLIGQAIQEVREQMAVSSAQFGLATNGLQLQLWQRHGAISVLRTPLYNLSASNIEQILSEIRARLESPRRALTAMFWAKKGGVGKTTMTANLGAALAQEQDAKVLLVNFDLQGDLNTLTGFPQMWDYTPPVTMQEALDDAATGVGEVRPDHLIREQSFEVRRSRLPGQALFGSSQIYKLYVIPGDESIKSVERRGPEGTAQMTALQDLLEEACGHYDYIFIDASPSWIPFGKMAAHASDILIPVIDDSKFAVEAVKDLRTRYLTSEEFQEEDETSEPPMVYGCIVNCLFQGETGENSVKRVREQLEEFDIEWRDWVMGRYAETVKSIDAQKPVVFKSPNNKATKNFLSLANSIFVDSSK